MDVLAPLTAFNATVLPHLPEDKSDVKILDGVTRLIADYKHIPAAVALAQYHFATGFTIQPADTLPLLVRETPSKMPAFAADHTVVVGALIVAASLIDSTQKTLDRLAWLSKRCTSILTAQLVNACFSYVTFVKTTAPDAKSPSSADVTTVLGKRPRPSPRLRPPFFLL